MTAAQVKEMAKNSIFKPRPAGRKKKKNFKKKKATAKDSQQPGTSSAKGAKQKQQVRE